MRNTLVLQVVSLTVASACNPIPDNFVPSPTTPLEPSIASTSSVHTPPSARYTPSPPANLAPSTLTYATPTGQPPLLPTYDLADGDRVIPDLMATNGGCKLPCWWGIMPGTTRWSDARQFLSPFSRISQFQPSGNGDPMVDTLYIANYWNPGTDDNNGTGFSVFGDTILYLSVAPETSRFSFQLHQLLADYGPPDDVFITWHAPSTYAFTLELPYLEQRFIADYQFLATAEDSLVEGCVTLGPGIQAWAPGALYVQRNAMRRLDRESWTHTTLVAITAIDPATFHDTFASDTHEVCLQLPTPPWK